MLSLKDALIKSRLELTTKNKPNTQIEIHTKKLIDNFITIFCEHNLANTDYIEVQREAVGHPSLAEYIHTTRLLLPAIVKCLTYFIWTDRIIEGYFVSKIKDGSLNDLLSQLQTTLKQEEQFVIAS